MIVKPTKYGFSVGGFKPTQDIPLEISFKESGLRLDIAASQIDEGEASNALDVRFTQGGVTTDYNVSAFGTPYGGAELKDIVHLANYQKDTGTKFLMRLRPTGWDRWNGANWATVPGALGGSQQDRLYSTVMNNKFVACNLVDPIKVWDGVDATPVADLSATAPICKFITRVGTRLFAAVIKDGGIINPHLVAWPTEGDWTDWVGAGSGLEHPPVEGPADVANFITGLSNLERAAVIYRQKAIQLAQLTGVGDAPFRFTTIDFTHGTESPYSIRSGGAEIGDFFLGEDYMVYLFNGKTEPVPIGLPIYEFLRDSISDRSLVVGAIDANEQEYYLAYPSSGELTFNGAFVFSIREYIASGRRKLVWRRRTLPANTMSFGYGFLGVVNDPIVDTITDIVDTITIRVDDWDNSYGPNRILFGNNVGQVYQIDKTTVSPQGVFESKEFRFSGQEVTCDKIKLLYKARANSTVAVSISTDGGKNYQAEKVYNLSVTNSGDGEVINDHVVTGASMMFRIRPLTGYSTITKLETLLKPRGLGRW